MCLCLFCQQNQFSDITELQQKMKCCSTVTKRYLFICIWMKSINELNMNMTCTIIYMTDMIHKYYVMNSSIWRIDIVSFTSQWTHGVMITSLLRQYYPATLYWPNNDIITPYVHLGEFYVPIMWWGSYGQFNPPVSANDSHHITRWGLASPYGVTDLGQHKPR